ncbi:MAG: hypothetical protein NZ700_04330 [Gemmataceae bacterium]|nr:hypothetical protein [Gemmataceae bacterium]MDW8264799.1 hypothetical protein [Gemmataceae bacterium]
MRLVARGVGGLAVVLLEVAGLREGPRAWADDLKPEHAPAAVRELAVKYLSAAAANDAKEMLALADVPWLDRRRQLVRDRADLRKAVERVAHQLLQGERPPKIESFPYAKFRGKIANQVDRQLLDEVLGNEGWLVMVQQKGNPLSLKTILIRVKDGQAAVVGGPISPNHILGDNRIPEEVDQLLDKAETFELYSLDPGPEFKQKGKRAEARDGFHGWKVLGKTEVNKEAERRLLADVLRLGVEENYGIAANCFQPRHGLRLHAAGKTVDLVICFECFRVEVFINGEQGRGFYITGEPQKEFDLTLKAAGVPLPEPATK